MGENGTPKSPSKPTIHGVTGDMCHAHQGSSRNQYYAFPHSAHEEIGSESVGYSLQVTELGFEPQLESGTHTLLVALCIFFFFLSF